MEIAALRAKNFGFSGDKVQFLKMDCEKTGFPANFFDIAFDGGSFSSLDLSAVFPEIVRILKPEGKLIGIETFGHNPIANLKRKLNKLLGKRTGWAESHILKTKDLEEAKKYFYEINVYFFHLFSSLIIPFLSLPGAKIILRLLEDIDKILLAFPFLKKYAFKVVFIFKNPKK